MTNDVAYLSLSWLHSPFSKDNRRFITRIFDTRRTPLKSWLTNNAHFIFVVIIIVIKSRYSPCPLGYPVIALYFDFEFGFCSCIVAAAVCLFAGWWKTIIVAQLLVVIAWRSSSRWWWIHDMFIFAAMELLLALFMLEYCNDDFIWWR